CSWALGTSKLELRSLGTSALRARNRVARPFAAEDERVGLVLDRVGEGFERAEGGAEFVKGAGEVTLHGTVRSEAFDAGAELLERCVEFGGQILRLVAGEELFRSGHGTFGLREGGTRFGD